MIPIIVIPVNRMMNEYTDDDSSQIDMRAVSFSGFSALNFTLYSRIFIWGEAPPAALGRPPMLPVATRLCGSHSSGLVAYVAYECSVLAFLYLQLPAGSLLLLLQGSVYCMVSAVHKAVVA